MNTAARFIFLNIVLVVLTVVFGTVIGAIFRFFNEDMTRWQSFGYGVVTIIMIDWFYTAQKQVIKWSFGD